MMSDTSALSFTHRHPPSTAAVLCFWAVPSSFISICFSQNLTSLAYMRACWHFETQTGAYHEDTCLLPVHWKIKSLHFLSPHSLIWTGGVLQRWEWSPHLAFVACRVEDEVEENRMKEPPPGSTRWGLSQGLALRSDVDERISRESIGRLNKILCSPNISMPPVSAVSLWSTCAYFVNGSAL